MEWFGWSTVPIEEMNHHETASRCDGAGLRNPGREQRGYHVELDLLGRERNRADYAF